MSVYVVTGRLGSGKSLLSVARMADYAAEGRRVASNFHVDFSPISRHAGTKLALASVTVIPDRPSAADLDALGRGGPSEDRAGLLVLDECATFLNSRTWAGPGREALIDWLLHSRKKKWDVILIVQHQSMLDKQVREALGEHLCTMRRLDKFRIPFVSWAIPIRLPRMHVGQVRYGMSPADPMADWWYARGNNYFDCYSTEWVSQAVTNGLYSVLPAQLSKHRYVQQRPLLPRLLGVLGVAVMVVLITCLFGWRSQWARPRRAREAGRPAPCLVKGVGSAR